MLLRLAAIVGILLGTSVAWFVLGGTISYRTSDTDGSLSGRVASLWGGPQVQAAPVLAFNVVPVDKSTAGPIGESRLTPESSDIRVGLHLEHRRKGLLWYATYTVDFQGDYQFLLPETGSAAGQVRWDFPASSAMYDELQFLVNGSPVVPRMAKDHAFIDAPLAQGQPVRLHVQYRSQGLQSWRYRFGENISSLPNFHLRMATDFKAIDFDDNALSPTSKVAAGDGWQMDWSYRNLYSGHEIAVLMPDKAQPGPLAAQISFFAPVALLFYFFVVWMLANLRGLDLHPMNYFFLACSFFAFHLLMAYMVDHIDIYAAFALSSVVSTFLAVSYLRLVTGWQFAIREAALAQFVYLVLFSFAFFFKGFTGLAVTVGAILTLFAAMQLTGKISWTERFAAVRAISQ